jgi:hypothetical protein
MPSSEQQGSGAPQKHQRNSFGVRPSLVTRVLTCVTVMSPRQEASSARCPPIRSAHGSPQDFI